MQRHFFLSIFFLISSFSAFADSFPKGPDRTLTPGSLCESGKSRHPQKITYCERNVSSAKKWEIFRAYNNLGLGYNIHPGNRGQYKIDHFYPLCIGGSNNHDNLWPQHETLYTQTDDIEHLTCEMVSTGQLKRDEALRYVIEAKTNIENAKEILKELRELSGRALN